MCHPEICHLKCLENARTMMIRRGMFTSETRGLSEGVGSVRKVSAVQNLREKVKLTEKSFSLIHMMGSCHLFWCKGIYN